MKKLALTVGVVSLLFLFSAVSFAQAGGNFPGSTGTLSRGTTNHAMGPDGPLPERDLAPPEEVGPFSPIRIMVGSFRLTPNHKGENKSFQRGLDDLRDEYRDEKRVLSEERKDAIHTVKEEYAERKQELQDQMKSLRQEEKDAIAAVEDGMDDEAREKIDELKAARSEALKELRKQFVSDLLTTIKEKRLDDIIGTVKDYIADRKEVKEAFAAEIQEQAAGLSKEEKQQAIDEIKEAFAEERQEIKDQIKALKGDKREAIAATKEEYKDKSAALKDEYRDKITELWQEKYGVDSQPPERVFRSFFKRQKHSDRHHDDRDNHRRRRSDRFHGWSNRHDGDRDDISFSPHMGGMGRVPALFME